MIWNCTWNNLEINCCDEFLPLETELGVCYSINSFHTEYVTLKSIIITWPKNMFYTFSKTQAWVATYSQSNIWTGCANIYGPRRHSGAHSRWKWSAVHERRRHQGKRLLRIGQGGHIERNGDGERWQRWGYIHSKSSMPISVGATGITDSASL